MIKSICRTLFSDEFVGMVSDMPDQKVKLKAFHAEIINDHAALKEEEESYKEIFKVRDISHAEL